MCGSGSTGGLTDVVSGGMTGITGSGPSWLNSLLHEDSTRRVTNTKIAYFMTGTVKGFSWVVRPVSSDQ